MLCKLFGINQPEKFRQRHRAWVATTQIENENARDTGWSSSIAVGSEQYIEQVKTALGKMVKHRDYVDDGDKYLLREPECAYRAGFDAEKSALS